MRPWVRPRGQDARSPRSAVGAQCPAAPGLRRLESRGGGGASRAPLGGAGSWEAARAPGGAGLQSSPPRRRPPWARLAPSQPVPLRSSRRRRRRPHRLSAPERGAARPGRRERRGGSARGRPGPQPTFSRPALRSLACPGQGGAWDREGKGAGKVVWPCGEGRCPREPSANRRGCPCLGFIERVELLTRASWGLRR